MNPLEEEYKNKFSDEQLSSNGFEAEGLWDAISEELHAEPNNKVKPLWWVFIPGITIMFTVGFWIIPNWNSQEDVLNGESTSEIEAPLDTASVSIDEVDESYALGTMETKQTDLVQEDVKQTDLVQKEVPQTDLVIEEAKQTDQVSVKADPTTTKTTTSLKNIESPLVVAVDEGEYYKEIPPVNTINHADKNEALVLDSLASGQGMADIVGLTIREKEQLPMLAPIDGMTPPYLELSAAELPVFTAQPVPLGKDQIKAKSNNPSVYLQLYGGTNFMDINYRGESNDQIVDLKNQSERIFPSTQFGVKTDVQFSSGFSAHLGIEYQQHRTVFEIEQENLVSILLDDQLIKVWLDGTSLDTLAKEYGSVLVDGIETRRVIHNNRYKMLGLPVGVGYSKQIGNVMLGLEGGLYLGFTLDQNGKTLNGSEQIISFDNESLDRPLNDVMLGYRMSPSIAVQGPSNLSFAFRPEFSGFSRQQIGDSAVYSSPLVFSINLGVKYQIK